MLHSRIYAAKNFSSSQENKIRPEGKRKSHIGSILSPFTNNTPHIENTNFNKKYSILPKIEDDIETLLQEHGEIRKKYEELSEIADIHNVYENGMYAYLMDDKLKYSEKKLGISRETRHKYLKGSKI
jgi:hypothetical protein